jgi:hypothetical protein
MSTIVRFNDTQIATAEDLNRIGEYQRQVNDNLSRDVVGATHRYSGFVVTQTNQQTVAVAPGRYHVIDAVYESTVTQQVQLAAYLPLQSNLFRWVALILRGQEADVNESRQVETDVDTGELTTQVLTVGKTRVASVVILSGTDAPSPLKPGIDSSSACIAFIRLASTGIIEIERAEDWRLKPLVEIEARLAVGERLDETQGTRIASLESDLANVARSVRAAPRPEAWRQLRNDVARLVRLSGFPDTARAEFWDHGLIKDKWDLVHANANFRVREGLRFPSANEREAPMVLQDPTDPKIRVTEGFLLPAWTEKARINIDGNDGEISVSSVTHTVTTAIRREISRSSVSYGPVFHVCENRAEWAALSDRRPGEVFANGGETFNVVALTDHVNNSDPELSQDHKEYAVRQVTYDSWTEVYWDYVTTTEGLSGSIFGQTFLNAQPGWLTSIDLRLTRVGAGADLKVLLVETGMTGVPDLRRVIASTTVPAASLVVGWNKAAFVPSFLELGKLYAWVVVTTGNHWLATVTGNKFAQGSRFHSTDGFWFQGSTTEDFAFRANYASHTVTRVEVPWEPLTLENGMTSFRLNYPGWVPAGTRLQWEFKPSGSDTWYPVSNYANNPLGGLPALCQLRAVFIGTTDLMPGIMVTKARSTTVRSGPNMVAMSNAWNFGVTSSEVIIEATLDTFDATRHTFAPRLRLPNNTVELPDVVTTEIDPLKPDRRTVRAVFNFTPGVSSARLQLEGTTNTVAQPFFVQDVFAYVN